MAGSITTTATRISGLGLTQYTMAWTSSADTGAVSGVTVPVQAGHLRAIEFVPGTGATQPDNAYDVTLLDVSGADLLYVGGSAQGANLSNTVPTVYRWDPPLPFAGGTLAPTVAAANTSKTGTFILTVG